MNFLTIRNSNLVLINCALVILSYILLNSIVFSFLFLFGLIAILFSDRKVVISLIIIGYLAITSEFFESYRIYTTVFGTALLIFYFLREYGFNYKNYTRVPNVILYFLGILFITITVSSIASYTPSSGFVIILRMFFFFIICYLFFSLIKKQEDVFSYLYSICIVTFIFGIRMLIDVFNFGTETYFIKSVISESTDLYGSLNYTRITIFFISSAILTSLLFLKNKILSNKLILVPLLIINFIILIFANSRGGIIAAVISISFILLVVRKYFFLKIITSLTVIALCLIYFSSDVQNIFDSYLRWHTVGDRMVYWEAGINVIKDYPVFGLGPGQFDDHFFSYAPSSTVKYLKMQGVAGTPHPHNFFLFFTAENGLLGLLTSVLFFVVFLYFGFKTISLTKGKDYDFYIMAVTITGIGIALFIRSFIEVSGYLTYGYITIDLPFWLMFGILLSIYQKYSKVK